MAIAKPADDVDASLVEAARAGDKEAFGVLADRHRPMVLALVRRLVGDEAMAADAAQEAAVTALVALPRLRSPERFGAWYAGIALNIARHWLRRTLPTAALTDEWPDARPGPDEMAAAAELAQRVREAVRSLPPGQRGAVLAFYWQGLSHTEAAAELAVSPGAVKARLHQARTVLRPGLVAYNQHHRHHQRGKEVISMSGTKDGTWVEVEVSEVRRSADGDDPYTRVHAVILKERGGDRRLPVYVGAPEAVALACSLEAVDAPRPMTYQFALDLARAGGSTVSEVRATTLSEHTFYAVALLDGPAGRAEVGARPSDAVNLALVCGAPVLVNAALFDDDEVARHDGWKRFPTGAPELAGEVRERTAKQWALTGISGTEPEDK